LKANIIKIQKNKNYLKTIDKKEIESKNRAKNKKSSFFRFQKSGDE
jgi:hypothetical protein